MLPKPLEASYDRATAAGDPLDIARRLAARVARLHFAAPVAFVYNPLRYAGAAHAAYLKRFGTRPREVLLVGMNPGPWGMAQTGVPFGDVRSVREWLGIEAPVRRPAREHPKRPILGFACPRREVSGARLWGWARDRFQTPDRFFKRFMVLNYCPLMFTDAQGRNLTPDKLTNFSTAPLLKACDEALVEFVRYYGCRMIVGVGAFAARRAETALNGCGVHVGRMPHPSPASPAANRDWAGQADMALRRLGLI